VLVRSSVDLDRPEPEESHIHHVPPHPSVRKSNTSESTLIVSARKPVRPTAVGPLGDDLVLVAKGRFQASVDDARLFGRDWGLRLTDVKASVLADQRMRRSAWHTLAIELPDGLVVRRVKGGAVTEDHRSNRGRHPGWGRWCRVRFRRDVGRRRLSDYGAETRRGRSGRGRGYQVDQARRFVEARHSQRRQPE
jgi:hypothetical protein